MPRAIGLGIGSPFSGGGGRVAPPAMAAQDATVALRMRTPRMSFSAIHGAGIEASVALSMSPAEMSFSGTVEDNPIQDPLQILGASLLQWVRADLGVTLNGSDVSAWADQSGNGHDYAQGTASAQPAFQAAGGPNSQPCIEFDGVDELLVNTTLDLPAPGTTPTLIWLIMRTVTWTGGRAIVGSDASFGCELRFANATPDVSAYNGVDNLSSDLPVATWGRVQGFFNNATTDYTRAIAGAKATGNNAGNTNPGLGRRIGRGNPSGFANFLLAEYFIANRDTTALEDTALDAYVTSRYGAGLV